MSGYADPINPNGRLVPPGDYSAQVEQTLEQSLGLLGHVVDVVNFAVGYLCGGDIERWIIDQVGGNYGQLLSVRDAWNCTGWAVGDIGDNLNAGLSTLQGQSGGASVHPHWSGHAADAFAGYMTDWGAALNEDQQACFLVRDNLTQLSAVAADTLTMVGNSIAAILHILAGAGVSIEIPVWGEYKMAKYAWEMVKVIRGLVKVFSAFHSTITLAISTFNEILAVAGANTNPSVNVHVPDAAYAGPVKK